MPRILLETIVATDFRKVFAGFNQDLFMQLRPPLLPFNLRRFDGCAVGDEVHIGLGPGVEWQALIVEQEESADEIYFVDTGKQLPPPLKDWRHRHGIQRVTDDTTRIVDDITYTSGLPPLDWLMYPVLYVLFAIRGPVYRKVFGKI
jgi:ligand-binding SRPBCC domain-containing protein